MTWESVPLKDVGTWFGGGTPAKSRSEFWHGGSIPWLSPKDMGSDILTGTQDQITQDAVDNSSAKLLPANSVAVVVRSGILERRLPVSVVPFETTLNQDMKAVRVRDGISPRWIAWALRAFEREILRTTRKAGTTVASIEWPRFQQFSIPIPSPSEQDRILAFLEDHLSRLDAADALVERSMRRTRSMRDATLTGIVEQARAVGGAKVVTIADIAKVSSGLTPLKGNKAFYDGGDVPWITSGDLHQGVITRATHFVTDVALRETSLKIVPAGSLLVAMYGEGKTRGTAAELAIDATTNQACAAVALHDPDLKSWVRLVLDANYTKVRRLAAGGVQPNLNLSIVKAIEIPMPSDRMRADLLARRTALDEANGRLLSELSAARRRATRLRQSLLTMAFSGRLAAGTSSVPDIDAMIGA